MTPIAADGNGSSFWRRSPALRPRDPIHRVQPRLHTLLLLALHAGACRGPHHCARRSLHLGASPLHGVARTAGGTGADRRVRDRRSGGGECEHDGYGDDHHAGAHAGHAYHPRSGVLGVPRVHLPRVRQPHAVRRASHPSGRRVAGDGVRGSQHAALRAYRGLHLPARVAVCGGTVRRQRRCLGDALHAHARPPHDGRFRRAVSWQTGPTNPRSIVSLQPGGPDRVPLQLVVPRAGHPLRSRVGVHLPRRLADGHQRDLRRRHAPCASVPEAVRCGSYGAERERSRLRCAV